MQEKIIKLLDDYYGDSRSQLFKKEIAEFVLTYVEDIKRIAIEDESYYDSLEDLTYCQNRWWCCGVSRPLNQSCSCGERYDDRTKDNIHFTLK